MTFHDKRLGASGEKTGSRGFFAIFRSKAFRRGLIEGFASPAEFFAPSQGRRCRQIDVSVEGAWKAVGEALSTASKSEVKRIGQTAREVAAVD
jgi:hypothetical protein